MKRAWKTRAAWALGCILAATARTGVAQPFSLDENGNGTKNLAGIFGDPAPLPFTLTWDPTGGITGVPVLIYSLGSRVASGDVALMEPDQTTIADLLRFFTPLGGTGSYVIFYSRVDGSNPSLADVGIPFSANPFRISETSPQTAWDANYSNLPGSATGPIPVLASYEYTIITDVPEPGLAALLPGAVGVWLAAKEYGRKGFRG